MDFADGALAEGVEEAEGQGVVTKWSNGFPDGEGRLPPERHQRWRATPTMTALPKWLARDLEVKLSVRIEAIEAKSDRWEAVTETGERYCAGALFLSAPLPQSLGLLKAGKVALPPAEERMLHEFSYYPCFSLLARVGGDTRVPSPGGFFPFLANDNEPIAWMADNRQKGTSPLVSTVTILGGHKFSQEHFDADPTDVEQALLAAAKPWLAGEVLETDLHRWRYSEPVAPFPFPFLRSAFPLPLYFIGDAFLGARVEGAAVSGISAAKDFLDRTTKSL